MENKNLRDAAVSYTANTLVPNAGPSPTPLFADVSGSAPSLSVQPIATSALGVPPAPPGLSPLPPATPPAALPVAGNINTSDVPRNWKKILIRSGVGALILLLVAASVLLFNVLSNRTSQPALNSSIASTNIPLSEFANSGSLSLLGTQSLAVNGQLRANESFILAPQAEPAATKSERGQLYYDTNTNQLAYYNGTQYVQLPGNGSVVQTFQGQSGNISLVGGNGITITGTTLTNSGVTSVGGQTGDISLGTGLAITGGTLQSTGVVSAVSGSPANLSVTNDGNGNITITNTGAGTGTVQSPGGTTGHVALFTAAQTIEDSIITQSGTTVTVGGDLSVTGNVNFTNALTVANGGTGAQTLTANGVIVGNGTSALTSVAAAGSGLCLMSTGGAPAFSVCPGGAGGVDSLNGLTGALTLANATALGSTVTINDATTTGSKGIASFNATNFSASGGAVNTIQNINTGATPTFAGVNTNTITPSAALTIGISAQTALLQGSTTTITSSGAGASLILNSGGSIELQDNTNITGNGTLTGDLAVNGGDITSTGALNITPTGTLTAGSAAQTLTLQGNASTTLLATNGANTTTIAFANPVAGTTLNFPALAAGTYSICTSNGNCAGAGVTLQAAYNNSSTPEIVLDATRTALTIRDNAVAIGGNLLEVQNNSGATTYFGVTATGATVTGTATVSGNINSSGGSLQTGGTTRIDNSGNAINIAALTLSGAISGGTSFTGSGNINSTGGALQTASTTRIDNTGNLVNIAAITASGNATLQGGTVTLGTNAQLGSLIINDGSSNTGTIRVAALGQDTVYTIPDPGAGTASFCLTTGNCSGVGGGVTTSGGTTNRLSKFSGAQAITDSTITDNGTTVTTSVNMVIQGGSATLGTAAQAGSLLLNDGNGQTTTLQAGDSVGNLTFVLPTSTGSATQCLKQSGSGNQLIWDACEGGLGGISTTLQQAYGNGNAITTTDARDVNITLANTTTDSNFAITVADGSTGYFSLSRANGGGTNDPAQLLLVDNQDTDRPVAVGVKIQAAAGGITTAIDASDAEIGDALNVGANNIVGTTGNLTFSNFSVTGASGNIVAGTYNSQTISSAANFTGSVTVATDLTLTAGDIAVNGGDITASGALNITPGGTLTAGTTGQALTLQGNASTKITATGGGFTTTVGFTGTPIGAVNYNFDRSVAAGTYNVCSTAGNCAGVGGGVTTSGGTTGTLAMFTGSQAIGDSLLSQAASTVTLNGNLNISSGVLQTGGTTRIDNSGNATNIGSLTLSGAISGGTSFTGSGTINTTGGVIQTANVTRIDNSGNLTNIGSLTASGSGTLQGGGLTLGAAAQAGSVVINDGSSNIGTLKVAALGQDTIYTLPDAGAGTATICLTTGNCAGTGTGVTTAGGSLNRLAKFSGAQAIADSTITDNGTTVTTSVNMVVQGGSATLGTTSQIGSLLLHDGNGQTATISVGSALVANTALAIPTAVGASDTFCLVTLANCTTSGVTSIGTIDTQTKSANGAVISGNSLVLQTADTSFPGLVSTGLQTFAGDKTFSGDIAVNGGDITASGALNITPGGTLTAGATGQALTLQGNASTKITATASGFKTTVGFTGTPTGAVNYTFDQAATPGTYAICTAIGNCLGGSGGANTALSNLSGVAINTTLLPGAAGTINLGSSTLPFGELSLAGTSGTPDTNNFKITGAATGGTKTITIPNATGTICLDTNNCSYAPATGSANYIQNQSASPQSADFQITGNGRAATFNGTTGINTGATTGTQRIDASGNLVNIGTVTTSGAINSQTISSTANFTGTVTIQGSSALTLGVTGTSTGAALFKGATAASGTLTLIGQANPTNNTITLPNETGTICLQNSVNCGFATGAITLQNAYNNGNSITATNARDISFVMADTATDPNFLVNLQCSVTCSTNGRFAVQSGGVDVFNVAPAGGAVDFINSVNSTQAFNIETSGGGNLFTVDTVNSQIGVNLGVNNVPSMATAGLQVQGALRVSGTGGSALLDTYVTPGGASIGARISVVNDTLTGFNQILAMGVTAASDSTTRAITLADGRTVAHQPTLAVLSPNENFIGGLSWDGSNTDFLFKNTNASGTVGLNINGTTTLQATTTGANVTGNLAVSGLSSGDALTVSNSTSTGNIAVFKDNATAVFTIANNGGSTFQNQTDSTAGFQILSSASLSNIPQFVVDTTNSRTYIGNPTGDTTGALLVLDTKTGSGDPTGVNGAIYYSTGGQGGAGSGGTTNAGKFRCFEGGVWQNCMGMHDIVERRWGYVVAANTTGALLGYSGDIVTGQITSGTGGAAPKAESNYLSYATAASTNSTNGWGTSGFSATVTEGRWQPKLTIRIRVDTGASTTSRYWAALSSGSVAAISPTTTTAAESTEFIGLIASSAVSSGAWICGSGDGATQSGVSTGVTITANHYYDVIVDMSVSGVLVCSVSDNGGAFTTVRKTTNLPTSATDLGVSINLTTLANSVRTMFIQYAYVESN